MKQPSSFLKKPAQALALTFLLILASGCQEPSASTANTNSAAKPAASSGVSSSAPDKPELTDANRAYEQVKKVVAFGPRPSGSAAIKKTQEYLIAELKGYGLRVMEDDFQGQTPKGAIPMKNIIAELPGQKPDIVIISGHYDTRLKPAGFLGANDGGSSTAAVLETARVMAKTKPEYTLWFVLFDGEEAVVDWGEMNGMDNTYGSRYMVDSMKKNGSLSRIKAMILYDMMGDKGLDLKRDGGSTPWLVSTLWKTGQQLGYSKNFLNEDTGISDDHIPFLNERIPAVDLIDFNYGPDNGYWHTMQDSLDKVSGESIKIVCDTVITALPEVFKQLNTRTGAARNN